MLPLPRSRTGGSGVFAGVFVLSRSLPAPSPGPRSRRDSGVRAASTAFSGACALHLADAFQRRDALAGDGLEPGAELDRVVGDQLGAVARAADLDIEALLRGEMRVPRLHSGDHPLSTVRPWKAWTVDAQA